jgi:FG-GAP repeat
MTWVNAPAATAGNGNLGYGSWGDCATNANITEYLPVADENGTKNSSYGSMVSIFGEYAIVGAEGEKRTDGLRYGAATIFRLVGNEWVFYQKIIDPAGQPGDNFGSAVAIENDFVFVGAYGDTETVTQQGSISVFKLIEGTWTFHQKLVDQDPGTNENFGRNLAISSEFLIAGSPLDDLPEGGGVDNGSACIFRLNSGSWTFFQKIIDYDVAFPGSKFGASIDIDGNYAVIGAPRRTASLANQGGVYIYYFNGSAWNKQQIIVKTDPGSPAQAGENFGTAVAISHGVLAIGAPYTDYVAPTILDTGSASVYKLEGSNWVFINTIFNNANGPLLERDYIGVSIDKNLDFIMISASESAIIYRRIGDNWQRYQQVKDPNGEFNDRFGESLSLDPSTFRFLIGAKNAFGSKGKAVFGKIN